MVLKVFYCEKLWDVIFDSVSKSNVDQFVIISGFLGPKPIEEMKKQYPHKSIEVIYGMYGERGISGVLHKKLKALNSETMNIWYSSRPVHSKMYIGFSNSKIIFAKVGSANFSDNGLCNDYREVLVDASEQELADIKNYLDVIKPNCTRCLDIKQEEILKTHRSNIDDSTTDCILSFLVNGEVPKASGLNWGYGNGHSSKSRSEAYIKIPAEDVKRHPELFPPRKSLGEKKIEKTSIDLIWDDDTTMHGSMEGTSNKKGIVNPKQLTSAKTKKIFGEYIRKRIGVSSNAFITKKDLLRYGRTDIKISLISEGVYYLDFSVKK